MSATQKTQDKHAEILKLLLAGKDRPSGVRDFKSSDQGMELSLFIPQEKVGSATRELIALLMSEAM
jgi:hypothetical protein